MLKKHQTKSPLEIEIDRLITEMGKVDPRTEPYALMSITLGRLIETKGLAFKPKFSPDAVLSAAASLAGILLILNFERLGIVTSKAISFVYKPRI